MRNMGRKRIQCINNRDVYKIYFSSHSCRQTSQAYCQIQGTKSLVGQKFEA
jgi:hypothetical protein